MGYAIFRIAKRQSRAAVRSMLRHALREDQPPNAIPGAPKPQPLAGDTTSGAALARLSAALRAAPRLRKDTVQALDILVTASHDDLASWPKERQDGYFARALDFIAARFGGRENILTAAIHRDETTPHMQVLVMPRDPATGRFVGARMVGGPKGLRALQDAFWEACGRPYGLKRGEKGSKAEHVPIRRFYAAISRSDRPLPDFKPVPPPPTWPDRLTGRAREIERRRKEAMEHNRRVREELLRRAEAAKKVHPKLLERAADRYRAAVAAEQLAQRAQEQARATVSQARARAQEEERRAQQARQAAQAAEASLKAIEAAAERGWTIGTVDAFSATVTTEYRLMLAQALGIPLKPGKLLDQVRRGLGLRSAREAIERIEAVAQQRGGSFVEAAAAWAARQEHERAQERPGHSGL